MKPLDRCAFQVLLRGVCTLTLAFALLLATHPVAVAMSRGKADKLAIEHLKVKELTGTVVLFGLKKPLGANRTVEVSVPGSVTKKQAKRYNGTFTVTHKVQKLRHKTWLYWLDLDYQAMFEHPSRLLLIDDATGKIRSDHKLRTYPLVDGRPPPFLARTSNYYGSKYKVLSSLTGAKTTSRTPARAPTATASDASALPQDAFQNDCLITATNTDDPHFEDNGKAMRKWAKGVGLRATEASSPRSESGPTGPSLLVDVKKQVRKGCKDVFLYISGHGGESGVPAITTANKTRTTGFGPFEKKIAEVKYYVTADDIVTILDQLPQITFKVKIQGCYSGRFISEANYQNNLLVMETSSAANQVSYGPIQEWKLNDTVVKNPNRDPTLSEFTFANIQGLKDFATSQKEVTHAQDVLAGQSGGSLLAWALARSFDLGKPNDFSQQIGLTESQRITNFPLSAPSR